MNRQTLWAQQIHQSTHIYLVYDEMTFRSVGEDELFSTGCGDNWVTIWEKRKSDPDLVSNIKPRWNRIETQTLGSGKY